MIFFRFIYDETKSPYYELTYLWFIQATFISACGATAVDTLFYASAFNLGGHFKAIRNRLENVNYEKIKFVKPMNQGIKATQKIGILKNSFEQNKLYANLIAAIQYHQEIYEMCQIMLDAYRPVVFMQFLISSVQLCVIAYQLTLV